MPMPTTPPNSILNKTLVDEDLFLRSRTWQQQQHEHMGFCLDQNTCRCTFFLPNQHKSFRHYH
ncbi:hypothetical protein YC2023_055637 [Brassica napus]